MTTTFNGEHWDSSKTSVCVKSKANKNAVRYYNCQYYSYFIRTVV